MVAEFSPLSLDVCALPMPPTRVLKAYFIDDPNNPADMAAAQWHDDLVQPTEEDDIEEDDDDSHSQDGGDEAPPPAGTDQEETTEAKHSPSNDAGLLGSV